MGGAAFIGVRADLPTSAHSDCLRCGSDLAANPSELGSSSLNTGNYGGAVNYEPNSFKILVISYSASLDMERVLRIQMF
jgi:hypothetical protein